MTALALSELTDDQLISATAAFDAFPDRASHTDICPICGAEHVTESVKTHTRCPECKKAGRSMHVTPSIPHGRVRMWDKSK